MMIEVDCKTGAYIQSLNSAQAKHGSVMSSACSGGKHCATLVKVLGQLESGLVS